MPCIYGIELNFYTQDYHFVQYNTFNYKRSFYYESFADMNVPSIVKGKKLLAECGICDFDTLLL